jgi:hypothetical protein
MTCETKRGNWLDAGCQIRDPSADFDTRNCFRQGLARNWLFKKTGGKIFNIPNDVARPTLNILFRISIKYVDDNLFTYPKSSSEFLYG